MNSNIATATISLRIFGMRGQWSLSKIPGLDDHGALRQVSLVIQGEDRNGYHLVIEPEGYHCADGTHDSVADALQWATHNLGVSENAWTFRAQ